MRQSVITIFFMIFPLLITFNHYWNCQLVARDVSGAVTVLGTGVSAGGTVEIDLVCWETEGDQPGGEPTGKTQIIKIK